MAIKKRQLVRNRFTYISFFLFTATFVYFSPYVIVDASAKGIVCGSFFMFSLLLGSFFVAGRRSFCQHLCWITPFMILGRKFRNLLNLPSLKLEKTNNSCTNCHMCAKNCLMSLDVELMVKTNKMENPECILCGTCADVCRKECIRLKF